MTADVVDVTSGIRVIDVDSHVSEPHDLWVSRVSSKWGDLVPHVRHDERSQVDRWYIGDVRLPQPAYMAYAGWKEFPPSHPPSLAEADRGAWDPVARLERMDEYGIYAQLLYPNIVGFQSHHFVAMQDQALAQECVRAYNDFLVDFASVSPDRLVPIMMLPYWDVDASIEEMHRSAARGHKGIIFGTKFERLGLPSLWDSHWDRLYSAAQDLELSINFHVGINAEAEEEQIELRKSQFADKATYAKGSALMLLGNAQTVADLILGGVCHRFPRLNFVSVESGAGWLPAVIEALDWQWLNVGAKDSYPERLLPSEYFRRQVYGSFWYERTMLDRAIELYPDNFMFETDYPHPTSLSPGPASFARNPGLMLKEHFAHTPPHLVRKVLHDNAARLYHL